MTAKVTNYLHELSDALADVPRDVRDDIVAGVREELEGLDEADAQARMAELGDPLFIAAAARGDLPAPALDSRALPTVAALAVMLGGLVIPVVGWLAGIVFMWMSPVFTRRTKVVVTILPAVVGLLVFAIATIVVSSGGGTVDPTSPLVDVSFSTAHAGILIAPVVAFATGIHLLVKARKRA